MASTDGRRWTTPKQEEWLNSKVPGYLEASSNRCYDKFWPPLYEEWFATFPEPDPDSDAPTEDESDDESDNAPPSDNDHRSSKPGPKKRKRHGQSNRRKNVRKKNKVGLFKFGIGARPLT